MLPTRTDNRTLRTYARRIFPTYAKPSQEANVINTIDTEKCTGCGTCFKTCGLDVFRLDADQPVLSPCMAKCPAGTDIRGYNALMQMGRIDEAAEKLRERNPFPALTGRVCPHLCEGECSRSRVDGAVNINGLEQYLGDRTLHKAPARSAVRHVHRIAVIGSGPAGTFLRLVPRPLRLPRARVRGHARTRRHAALRHPRLPSSRKGAQCPD